VRAKLSLTFGAGYLAGRTVVHNRGAAFFFILCEESSTRHVPVAARLRNAAMYLQKPGKVA